MTDADVDGAHIRILLLTFFYRYMRPMIDAGYIYVAQPPLYQIKPKGRKGGKYLYTDEELAIEAAKYEDSSRYTVQRYKGLGEMDPEQLWATTMEPKNRIMLRVTVEDALAADRAVSDLMGTTVEKRKDFIQTHAKDVRFLDI
jgi:DNA gyrase subunit B